MFTQLGDILSLLTSELGSTIVSLLSYPSATGFASNYVKL